MRDIIEKFREIQSKEGEEFFINNFKTCNGAYIKISADKPIEDDDILLLNNKTDVISDVDKYSWFKNRAFYSLMIGMDANNAILTRKGKMFISTVPYCIAFNLLTINKYSDSELLIWVNKYFNELANRYSFDENKVEIFTNLFFEKIVEARDKFHNVDRILLFIDEDLATYKESYEIYLKERVFLGDEYIFHLDEEKYGVMNFSTSLNSKKRILSCNTMRKYHYVVDGKDILLINNISNVLHLINDILNKDGDQIYNIEFNKGSISNYEIYSVNDKTYPLYIYSILSSEEPNEIPKLEELTHKQVREYIDRRLTSLLISKATTRNISSGEEVSDYIKDANKTFKDVRIPQLIITNKDCYKEYFEKGSVLDIGKDTEKLFKLIFEYNLNNTEDIKYKYVSLRESFDTIVSIMTYISDKEIYRNMAKNIKDIKETLNRSKNNQSLEISTDEEFFYLSGQVLQYLSSLSKSKDKNYREVSDFNKLRNKNEVKKKIIDKYDQYCHSIPKYSSAFINLSYQAIMTYGMDSDKSEKITGTELWYYYQAGLIGHNIFFEKQDPNKSTKTLN